MRRLRSPAHEVRSVERRNVTRTWQSETVVIEGEQERVPEITTGLSTPQPGRVALPHQFVRGLAGAPRR